MAKLKENGHLSIDKQISLYKKLKENDPSGYNFENEDQLTMYGYSFLWNDQPSEALQVFQLIAEQFPESANAYDSLGEAYLSLGKEKKSLLNYQKSLAMNPDNYNAEDYIERIKFPNKKKETPAELFSKVFPGQAFKDDLEDLGKKLIKTHPGIFKFTSEKDFLNTIEEKKALITDPLSNQHQLAKKEEITSINGTSIKELTNDIYGHISSQGLIKTTKRLFFNKWSTGLIPYAMDFPEQYTVEIKGKKDPITLLAAESHNDPVNNSPIAGCGEPLCLELIDQETAVLSIYSFNFYRWNNYDKFVEFMDKSFLEIKEKQIKNLVIDVRQNGGGAPEASIYLLQYLVDSSFTYFPGAEQINDGGTQFPQDHAFKGNQYYLITLKRKLKLLLKLLLKLKKSFKPTFKFEKALPHHPASAPIDPFPFPSPPTPVDIRP